MLLGSVAYEARIHLSLTWLCELGLVEHTKPGAVRLTAYHLRASASLVLRWRRGQCDVPADERGQRRFGFEMRPVGQHLRPQRLDGGAADGLTARWVGEYGVFFVQRGHARRIARVGPLD